jgi:hypothetical protein
MEISICNINFCKIFIADFYPCFILDTSRTHVTVNPADNGEGATYFRVQIPEKGDRVEPYPKGGENTYEYRT